jgi:triphosphatase
MSARTVAARERPAPDPARSDVFGRALNDSLKQIGASLPDVFERHDAEGLHQLRVALRRLNVALLSFGRSAAHSELRARTKAFATALAPAREYDVFLSELFDPVVAELGERTGFALLRQRAESAREAAWNKALAELKSPAFTQFRKDIAALPHLKPGPLKKAAPRLMQAHLKRVRKRGRSLKEMVPRECHRLRIALKKLRYAAELVTPLYGKKRVKRYLDQVETLQDLLGRLNDRAEVRAVLGRLTMKEADATVEADVSFAVGLILGWHRAGSDRLTKKTQTCWARFKDAEPFWL